MPENETLFSDVRSANRWRPIRDRLDGGSNPDDVFLEIQNQFYSSLRRVWRRWKDCNVDPSQVFEAALKDRRVLAELIRQTYFDSYARLIQNVADGLQVVTLEGLMRAFLEETWEAARNEIQLDCCEIPLSSDFINQVESMLERMLRGLLNNPSRPPRRPSRKGPPPDLDAQLGESLL